MMLLEVLSADRYECQTSDDTGPDVIHCDICDGEEYPDDLTPDWNGETGCHLSCEAEQEARS